MQYYSEQEIIQWQLILHSDVNFSKVREKSKISTLEI